MRNKLCKRELYSDSIKIIKTFLYSSKIFFFLFIFPSYVNLFYGINVDIVTFVIFKYHINLI